MSTTWILVANARHARLFAHHGPNKGLELVHEAMAEHAVESMRRVAGRLSPKAEPPRPGARSFASRLARDLYQGRSRGHYERAIIVAPPAFMGLLNAELDAPTASLVSDRLDKDYTKAPSAALKGHLQRCLCV